MDKLVKILLLIIINCSLLINKGLAQNLVPNPSFELGPNETSEDWANRVDTNCNILGIVGGPTFWIVTNSSPDRLFEGDINCAWDNDTAAFGSAYVVLGGSISLSEKGKTTLLSSLIADSTYYLSYYVQVENFLTSTLTPTRVSFVFNNGDTITSPLVNDSIKWVRYDTIFTASSSATEMELMSATPSFSSFKIDSITLQKVTLTSIQDNYQYNQITIYPNPSNNGLINIVTHGQRVEFSLFNSLGKMIIQETLYDRQQLNLTNYPKGIYFLKYSINNSTYTNKIIYY